MVGSGSARIVFLMCCIFAFANSHIINKRQANGRPSVFSNSNPTTLSPVQYQEKAVLDSILELALDISANQWEQGYAGNVVQSPISLASLLSLLLLGSRGETYNELKQALHYPNDIRDQSIHEAFQKITNSIGQTSNGVDVLTSSRLFLQEGLPIMGEFTKMANESYGSRVRSLNFETSPLNAMNRINSWVSRNTEGKIENLITQPFSRDTKFVAANVIYFDGEWENAFSDRFTQNGIFNTGTKNISIPMMTTLIKVPFLSGDQIGFDMVALPYKGGKYSMIIMTPRGNAGLQSLQRLEFNLDSQTLNPLIDLMTITRTSVTIPRMKLSHKIYLKKTLESFGVNHMFNGATADFGRLTSQTGTFVNDIVHEAILEITETGTVAAGASAAAFDRIGGNAIFHMDRPSLLFIRDNTNGLILFWARVTEPEVI